MDGARKERTPVPRRILFSGLTATASTIQVPSIQVMVAQIDGRVADLRQRPWAPAIRAMSGPGCGKMARDPGHPPMGGKGRGPCWGKENAC